jgi:hypothetical protein
MVFADRRQVMSAAGAAARAQRGADGAGELVYARIVGEVREGGLNAGEVGRIVGVAERQVRNWASGGNAPGGRNRDRLLELHYITRLLREVYTPEGAEIWLHGRKRSLGGRRPIDMLADGEFEPVLDAVEGLSSGAM